VARSWASPRPLVRHSSESVPTPKPPLLNAAPPPLPDSPWPLAETRISPVVVSTTRTVRLTSLFAFLPPRPMPFTRTAPPRVSVENFVMEPVRMYLTPSTLPTFDSLAADGSARSLREKSCSASTVSSFLRSITRNVPSLTSASTTWSAMPLPMSYWPHQLSSVPKSKSITATDTRFEPCAMDGAAAARNAAATARPRPSLLFIVATNPPPGGNRNAPVYEAHQYKRKIGGKGP
jgi:hypothetical protein